MTQDCQSTAQPDDDGKANIGKNDHHGKEEGKGFGQAHVYGDIPLSFLLYILMCPGLPVIGLDNPDSGKYFTGSLGEIRKRLLNILKTGRHAPCENPGEYKMMGAGISAIRVNLTLIDSINPMAAIPSTIPSVRATRPIPVAIRIALMSLMALAIKSPVLVF